MTETTLTAALARLVSNVAAIKVSLSTEDPKELREAVCRVERARDAFTCAVPQNESNAILRETAVYCVSLMLKSIKQHQENRDTELLCRMADAINIVLGDEPPPPPPTTENESPVPSAAPHFASARLANSGTATPPISKAQADVRLLRRRSNSLSPGIIPGFVPLCSPDPKSPSVSRSGTHGTESPMSDSSVPPPGSDECFEVPPPPAPQQSEARPSSPASIPPPPKFTGVRPTAAMGRPPRNGKFLGEYRSNTLRGTSSLSAESFELQQRNENTDDYTPEPHGKHERRSKRLSADFSHGLSFVAPQHGYQQLQQHQQQTQLPARSASGLIGNLAASAAFSLGASPANSPLMKPLGEKDVPASLSKHKGDDGEEHHILVPTRQLTIGMDDDEDKDKRDYVEQEIVLSEQSYVDGLRILVEVYEQPLKAAEIVPPESAELLFGNVSQLYAINKEFLSNLTTRRNRTGEVFKLFIPKFEPYIKYGESFDEASALLQKLKKTNSDFRKFLAKQRQLHSDVVSLDLLDALLITPIQRLPRYNLLLADLIKNTEPSDPDLPALKNAQEMMLCVAERVNERIKQSENIQKLQNIVRTIIFPTEDLKEETALVKPDRVFIREGDCQIVAIKKDSDKHDKKKPAHLFLFNDLLVMTMRKRMTSYYMFRQAENLLTCSADKQYEDPTRMLLKNQHEPIATLFFSSEDERDQWVYDIQKAHSELEDQPKAAKHTLGVSSPGSVPRRTDGDKLESSSYSSPLLVAPNDPPKRNAAAKSNSNPDIRSRATSSPYRDSQHSVPVPSPAPMPMPASKVKTTISPPSPVPLPRSSLKVSQGSANTVTRVPVQPPPQQNRASVQSPSQQNRAPVPNSPQQNRAPVQNPPQQNRAPVPNPSQPNRVSVQPPPQQNRVPGPHSPHSPQQVQPPPPPVQHGASFSAGMNTQRAALRTNPKPSGYHGPSSQPPPRSSRMPPPRDPQGPAAPPAFGGRN